MLVFGEKVCMQRWFDGEVGVGALGELDAFGELGALDVCQVDVG